MKITQKILMKTLSMNWNMQSKLQIYHKIRKTEKDHKKKKGNVESVSSCEHPVDSNRRLWFVSDFPHLVKSMKQRIVNAEELQTPDGPVKLKYWLIVVQEDNKRGIKVSPKLSMDHFSSDTYAAMSVGKAFYFFSEQAATAMEHYKMIGIKGMEDCDSAVKFIRRVNVLLDAMNSNTRSEGLKAPDTEEEVKLNPPVCSVCNKTHAENTPQRKKPARQHFSGEIRQGCGAHGHPDPHQFIQVYRLMSFKSLVKPSRGSSVAGGDMLKSLLMLPDHRSVENKRRQIALEKELDEALARGPPLRYSCDKKSSVLFSDHTYYRSLTIDGSAMKMFGGYVARKAKRSSHAKECEECFACLVAPEDQPLDEDDDIIHSRSKGYLLHC
ncbi:DNA transposase [Frankliniella fusca]|uniref:DNA transposase n=1 Tax=Frankliniella fusca TaxID=407009 RepID=A0AAE1I1R5_9NEOP|nr:DNA transposase [Frankliniella fusca]